MRSEKHLKQLKNSLKLSERIIRKQKQKTKMKKKQKQSSNYDAPAFPSNYHKSKASDNKNPRRDHVPRVDDGGKRVFPDARESVAAEIMTERLVCSGASDSPTHQRAERLDSGAGRRGRGGGAGAGASRENGRKSQPARCHLF